MSILNLFKKTDIQTSNIKSLVQANTNDIMTKGPTLHSDLDGLVWIADGPNKNYVNTPTENDTINFGSIKITISLLNKEEPSLIYTNQKISKVDDLKKVERPPYFPTYTDLTPEQKWVYLQLLSNPYDNSINIGFVFILYYGLERHLLKGDYEKAFRTILKLRDVHSNSSFQSYSASALILSAMLHKRGDLVLEFIESLDKEYEFKFSDNLFLISYYSFDSPIKSTDIMRMAKSFNFINNNYIKNYPDIFIDSLRTILLKKYGTDGILLKNLITDEEIVKVKSTKENIFANMSIIDEEISVPNLADCKFLKDEMFSLLEAAHNNVKDLLSERRKAGKPLPSQKESKPKKELVFDKAQEASLLKDLKKNSNNSVNKHFIYIYLQDFYYKYRSLDNQYIEKCKEYCLLDINSLEAMFDDYINQEIERIRQLETVYGTEETNNRINEIKKVGFIGNIPAFSRLSIIYEKEGNIEDAINICHRAISLKQSTEHFTDRISKLSKNIKP
jgi:hypothetical protein